MGFNPKDLLRTRSTKNLKREHISTPLPHKGDVLPSIPEKPIVEFKDKEIDPDTTEQIRQRDTTINQLRSHFTTRYAEAQGQILGLQQQIQDEKRQSSTLRQLVYNLEQRHPLERDQIQAQFTAKLSEIRRYNEALEQQVLNQKQRHEKEKEDLLTLLQKETSDADHARLLENEAQQVQAEMEHVKVVFRAKVEELTKTNQQLSERDKECLRAWEEATRLAQQNRKLQEELREAHDDKVRVQEELTQRINYQRTQLQKTQTRSGILREDVEKLRQELGKSLRESNDWKAQISDLQDRYNQQGESLRHSQNSAASLRHDVRDASDIAGDLAREIRRFQNSEIRAAAKDAQRATQIEQLAQQLQTLTSNVGRLEPFEEEANRLRPMIGDLRDSLRESQRAQRETEERLREAEAQNVVRVQRFAFIQQQFVDLNIENEQLKHEVSDRKRDLQSLRGRLWAATQEIQSVKADSKRMSELHLDEHRAARAEVDRLKPFKEELERLQPQLIDLRTESEGWKSEVTRLKPYEAEVGILRPLMTELRESIPRCFELLNNFPDNTFGIQRRTGLLGQRFRNLQQALETASGGTTVSASSEAESMGFNWPWETQ
jgi:chromosome segregation ATPase